MKPGGGVCWKNLNKKSYWSIPFEASFNENEQGSKIGSNDARWITKVPELFFMYWKGSHHEEA